MAITMSFGSAKAWAKSVQLGCDTILPSLGEARNKRDRGVKFEPPIVLHSHLFIYLYLYLFFFKFQFPNFRFRAQRRFMRFGQRFG